MALSSFFGGNSNGNRKRRKASAARKAARLAPPEERSADAAAAPAGVNGNGAKNDNGSGVTSLLKNNPGEYDYARNFDEFVHEGPQLFGVDLVVVVILGVAVTFILVISYLISQMPAAEG